MNRVLLAAVAGCAVVALAVFFIAVQPFSSAPTYLLPESTSSALAADGPTAGTLSLTTERFRLEDGAFSKAERGRLFVPMDRSASNSPVISVEFVRFPAATEAGAARPPIFQLPGGPGFRGLTVDVLEESGWYRTYVGPLRELADVVVMGQRGIGSSRPNTRCDGPLVVPPDTALTTTEEEKRLQEASRRCKRFWTEQGLDVNSLNVMEAAADVNAVREALGYESLILRGQSFGSHWSMAFMRRYPEIVDRALLSGLEGPNATYDMPSGILNSLKRTAEDAEQDEELAPHIPDGGLIQALEDVVDRLKAEPVTVTVEHPETGDPVDVRLAYQDRGDFADGYGPVPDSRHDMAGWPRDVLALYNGDYKTAARDKAEAHVGPPDFPTASFFALDCGSGITPEREQRLDDDPAQAIVGNTAFLYQAACSVWDVDLGNDFRTGFETDIPTVMVHGTWDLSTPYMNAKELQPAFTNGTLVTVKRGTHDAFYGAREASEDFAEGIRHFLKTGDRSKMPDTVTLPEVNWIMPGE